MRRVLSSPAALVTVGILLLQAAWIITVPPFRGIDEFDHAYRASAVAGGEWVAGAPADDPDDYRGWLVQVPEHVVEAAHAQCDKLNYTGPGNCSPVSELGDGEVLVASAAAGYHPALYWLLGTAARPFEGAGALYAMRLAGGLLCLAFMGLAAWALSKLPGSWPILALVLALTPVFVYSTALPAPNGLEMSAGASLWGSLLALIHGQPKRVETALMLIAILSAGVLGTLRLTGPLFIVLIVGTVAALNWRGLLALIRRRPRIFTAGVVLVGLSVANFAFWTWGPFRLASGSDGPDGSASFAVGNLIVWPLQAIAAFPYRDQMGPLAVYAVVGALVSVLVIHAVRTGNRRGRIVLLSSVAVALLLPIVLTLATIEGRGVIWQGRYGLPYALGFVLIAGYLLALHHRSRLLPTWAIIVGLAFYGGSIVWSLLKVRHDELTNNPASIGDSAWHAPSPVLLTVLVVAAMFAFGLAGSRRVPTDA